MPSTDALFTVSVLDQALLVAALGLGFFTFLVVGLGGIASRQPRPWATISLTSPCWGAAILIAAFLIPAARSILIGALLLSHLIVLVAGEAAIRKNERSNT